MKEIFQSFMTNYGKAIDYLAAATGIAVFAEIVPVIAGLFSIAWLGTQLFDRWLKKKD